MQARERMRAERAIDAALMEMNSLPSLTPTPRSQYASQLSQAHGVHVTS